MAVTQAVSPAGQRRPYPVLVRVAARPAASRWLWVVKWVLLIPHLVVLAFLWIAFMVLGVVALVAIVVTGRYPRAVFDFNVGVLRWTWRVTYYGYGVLGTDRYPPFTLQEVPDYPAHLEVAYPEHLSRGLALVKSWLLAVPHYLVLSVLLGSGTWLVATRDDGWRLVWGGGLVGILGLVAAVVLLFTGRYPGSVYDLLLGLHRWVLRVSAYAGLMTDAYPPFRLDQGPDEPGSLVVDSPLPASVPGAAGGTPATGAPSSTAPPRPGWTGGRVVSVVVGAVAAVSALVALTGGLALVVADHTVRDSSGFVTTAERPVSTSGYAVALTEVVLEAPTRASTLPQRLLGEVRLRVTPVVGDRDVFVGIGPTAEVERYLDGVARTLPTADLRADRDVQGGAPAVPPGQADVWTAWSTGSGTQQLIWKPRVGDWSVVLMNADGSAGIATTASVGATLPWLEAVGVVLLVVGAALLLAGATSVGTAVHLARTRNARPNEGSNPRTTTLTST